MSTVVEFALIGLGTGACYALLALGLVVTYRGSGVVNFATGAQALFAASVYAETYKRMNSWLAALLAVLLSGVVGVVIQLAVMRPLRQSSAIVRVVATLALLGFGEEAALKKYGTLPPQVKGVIPSHPVGIFGTTVDSSRLYFLAIAVVLYLGLYLLYRYSRFGLATTGVAENELATATLGYSPNLIAAANWGIGGLLAGVAGVLLVPVTGLSANALSLAVVPALAASLLGGFKSFPLTFVGALALGIMQSEATWYIHAPGWPDAGPFVIIIAVLVIRGRTLPLRSHIADRLPTIGLGRIRWQGVGMAGLFAVLLSLLSAGWADVVTTTAILALVCLSLVVVTGYAGQLSLAQFAFAGLGALIGSRLGDAAHMTFVLALLIAVIATVPLGILVALPAVRVRGANLAVVTMGLSVVVSEVVLGNVNLEGGAIRGTVLPPPSFLGININASSHPDRYAWVSFLFVFIAVVLVGNLRRSSTGRRLIAVRDNERAAASLGVSVVGSKIYAFALSSALASAAGVLMAFRQTYVSFDQYDVFASINAVLLAVIGGIGSIVGAMFGGVLATGGIAQNFFQQWWSVAGIFPLITALLLIPVVVLNPNGQAAEFEKLGRRILRARRMIGGRFVERRPVGVPYSGTDGIGIAGTHQRVRARRFELRDVTVRFGGVVALDGVSMTVEPGTVVGLIGPNGAGKTTLIDAATGYVSNTGSVSIDGEAVDELSPAQRKAKGLCRSFQSLELFDDLTVLENLCIGGSTRSSWRWLTDLVRPGALELPESAHAAIRDFQLMGVLEKFPGELPYAQRRLVAIARAVAASPSILLLDEPAAGLDDASTEELGRLVRTLAVDWGMGVLLIEHDVSMVFSTCDQVVAIDFGRKIGEGTPDEVRQSRAVTAAYLGEMPESALSNSESQVESA
jgi:sulfate-transporting ATPase